MIINQNVILLLLIYNSFYLCKIDKEVNGNITLFEKYFPGIVLP